MNRSKIEYIDFQWNPITGCLKECPYCISIKKSKRFSGDKRLNLKTGNYRKEGQVYVLKEKFLSTNRGTLNYPFGFLPTYHKYRFDNLGILKSTMNILVSGDGELFGPWISDDIICEVFENCRKYPKHHYLFLTQYPDRYEDLYKKGLLPDGDGFWYGFTVVSDGAVCWRRKGYHKFAVMEPLLGNITEIPDDIEWAVLGLETGSRKDKVTPPFEWIRHIVVECDYKSIPVYMMPSMAEIVGANSMRKDVPMALKERKMGDKEENKLMGDCLICKKHMRKSEMITLYAGRQRGVSPKRISWMCEPCFDKFKTDHGIGDEDG